MASDETELPVGKDEAVAAILAALPKDAIVRDEDDGVGRFAGQRTVVLIGHGRKRLMMFDGSWGEIKKRLEKPQLDVVVEGDDDTSTVTVTAEPPAVRGTGSYVAELFGNIVTVAALLVAYHFIRKIEIDKALVAAVSAGVGVAWFAVARFMPQKPTRGLADLVKNAIAPLAKPPA